MDTKDKRERAELAGKLCWISFLEAAEGCSDPQGKPVGSSAWVSASAFSPPDRCWSEQTEPGEALVSLVRISDLLFLVFLSKHGNRPPRGLVSTKIYISLAGVEESHVVLAVK